MLSINRVDLTREIVASKDQGELTPRGLSLISKLIAHCSSKYFETSDDMSYAILYTADKIMEDKSWTGFNPKVSDDAYPYMVQIIRCCFAKYRKDRYNNGR